MLMLLLSLRRDSVIANALEEKASFNNFMVMDPWPLSWSLSHFRVVEQPTPRWRSASSTTGLYVQAGEQKGFYVDSGNGLPRNL